MAPIGISRGAIIVLTASSIRIKKIAPINAEVIKLFKYVQQHYLDGNLTGILHCPPSYNKLIIKFDLNRTNAKKLLGQCCPNVF